MVYVVVCSVCGVWYFVCVVCGIWCVCVVCNVCVCVVWYLVYDVCVCVCVVSIVFVGSPSAGYFGLFVLSRDVHVDANGIFVDSSFSI